MSSSFKEKSKDVVVTYSLVLKGHDLVKDVSKICLFEGYGVRKWFVKEMLSIVVR